MKYTLSLLPCAILFAFTASAQRITLVNSGEVLEKASVLQDSGRFKDAIKELLTIPKRDTNYVLSLTKLAELYRRDDRPDDAIAAADIVLARKTSHSAEMICAKAAALDQKKEYDKALAVLFDGLKKYPYDIQTRFQVGTTYHNKHDYPNAIKAYYYVLEIYPYSAATHLNLGHIGVLFGNKTHAMLSLGMYLSLKENDNAKLRFVENLASNQLDDEGQRATGVTSDNAFQRLDQILQSKIAMDKKFKTEVPVDAATVRQFEMLFQQLNTASIAANDPWLKFYGPIYTTIRDKKMVTPFLNHILSSANIASVQKWNSKHQKEREAFFSAVRQKLNEYRAAAEYNADNKLFAMGAKIDGKQNGPYVYFHPNGERSAEGAFDHGKKVGTWKYYEEDGSLTSIENEESGEVTGYNKDGSKRNNYIQKDNFVEGEIKFYYSCGDLSEIRIHKAGNREGKGHFYYENGSLKADFEYAADKLTGQWIDYDVYGRVRARISYKNGLMDGVRETFWANGKTKDRDNYIADELNGTSEIYHDNGQLHYKGPYVKGLAEGEWLYYTRDGELDERRFFTAGDLDQENIFYYEGKPFVKHTYKNGLLVGSAYLDKNGNETSKFGSPDGTFEVKHFYQTGEVLWEGQYIKGKRTGKWTQYNREGNVKSIYNYSDGEYDGEQIDYHRNGNKKVVTNYKNGIRNGYVQEFYFNGTVSNEGWYVDGNKQQQWLEYYPDGSIAEDFYFLDDNAVDSAYTYAVDGTIAYRNRYVEGLLVNNIPRSSTIKYDTACDTYNGKFERLYPDGKIHSKFAYVNDRLSGSYQAFDENGVAGTRGTYHDGTRVGVWNYYNEAGRLDQTSRYVNGLVDSVLVNYYETGSQYNTVPYSGDERNGVAQYLAPNGQPIVEKKHNADETLAVRMTGKNGQFGDWKPVSSKYSVVAYYTNGQKAYEEEYVGGALSGPRRIYFPDGKVCRESNYVAGEVDGPITTYYANGKVCMRTNYRYGELDGLTEIFDETGRPVKSVMYKLGKKHGPTTLYTKGVKSKEVIYYNDFPSK